MDLSKKNKLDRVSVYDLMNNNFYIPDYQRGYRWTSFEVEKLLSDLEEFFNEEQSGESFYCMQPLVVKKRDDGWEVIDGQQRLTTLFLILSQNRQGLKLLYKDMDIFSLSYQSRTDSQFFLENIDYSRSDENIDYYHICNASKTIEDYLSKTEMGAIDFVQKIVNYNNHSRRQSVEFIWYNVSDENISAEDKFSDLNIGKISLTNAELIKALFLKDVKEDSSDALRIASEWDSIEHALQDDSFWSFIYGEDDNKYATRIEFLFDIIKKKSSSDNDYYTFDKYSDDIKILNEKYKLNHPEALSSDNHIIDKHVIDSIWKEISDKFCFFKGWYEDKKLYHIIGYLRYKKHPIEEIERIYFDSEILDIDAFYHELKKIALSYLKDYNIRELSYENNSDHGKIKDVLLLFNILSIINCEKEYVRFSFEEFYKQKWDIEHVRSQTPKEESGEGRKDWIVCNIEYFSGIKYNEDLNKYKSLITKAENRDIEFIPGYTIGYICDELLKLLTEKTDITETEIYKVLFNDAFKQTTNFNTYKHSIGNLVLLDQGTNRGYKNAFFPVKRQWILRREHEGIYILPCTKNVFSKNYSNMLYDLMNWNNDDAKAYMTTIEEVLKDE